MPIVDKRWSQGSSPHTTTTTTYHSNSGTTRYYHSNRNSIWGTAFTFFLIGICCFVGSIYLICYNERRAVKDTYFADILRNKNKVVEVNNADIKIVDRNTLNDKVFVINGK